jgi:ribosomal protein S1
VQEFYCFQSVANILLLMAIVIFLPLVSLKRLLLQSFCLIHCSSSLFTLSYNGKGVGEIDNDWYEKRRKEIDDECRVYDCSIRKKEERESLFELRQARLKTLQLGQLVDGTVVAFKSYGLFVNIGGYSALLHISGISQIPVEDLKQIFQLDGWVRAIITYLDVEKGRVGISTKELESRPGDMLKNPVLVYQNAEEMAKKYRLNKNL